MNVSVQEMSFNTGSSFQMVDSAIDWINHYPVDNAFGLCITYPLDSDLSNEVLSIFLNNWGQVFICLTSAQLDKLLSPVIPPQNC